MTIQIGAITFDEAEYDDRGDVLYLNVREPEPAAQTLETSEGHAVHYDRHGSVIGLTLLNVRQTLKREGELTISWPQAHLSPEQLGDALTPA